MKYLKVNGLDKQISELVMGTAWFSPDCVKEIDEMLDLYVNVGGNTLDTGRFYGIARSEKLLANWLKKNGKRDQLVIIDKACHPIITSDGVQHPDYWRVKPDLITEDLNYSLFNMGLDYFDIYLMHRDDENIPVEEIMDRLEKHRKEGKIKVYGVSNWSLDRVKEANEYCKKKGYNHFSINNPSYSLATVGKPRWYKCVYADDAYAKWHENTNITLISYASQAAGFFVPVYKTDGSAPKDIQEAYFNEANFKKMDRCKELGAEKGVEPVNIALAYILNQTFPVAAVIGTRNKDEFLSSLHAIDIKLTPAEVKYLALKSDKK